MKTRVLFLSVLCGLTLWLGCSSQPKKAGGDGNFKLRSYSEDTLSNQLKVLYVKDTTLPKLRITLMVKMGATEDPKGKEGLSNMLGSLLDHGTVKRNATQIADELGELAADFNVSTDEERTLISVSSLDRNRDETLGLLIDMVTQPAFSEGEITRRKTQILSRLKKLSDNPSHYADLLSDQLLFPQHPYGSLIVGDSKSIANITRDDIVKHYWKYMRPENSWLVIAGDFDEAYLAKLRDAFSRWSQGSSAKVETKLPADVPPGPTILYSKKGLQQAQIRFGELGIARKDPDHMALRLASMILGGDFESRLNSRIRVELGLTYGISSHFQELLEGGSFEINTACRNEVAPQVITETKKVLADFVAKGVTDQELAAAKNQMIFQFPTLLETPAEVASNLMNLRFYHIPDSYLLDYASNVKSLTKEQVNAAIRAHIHPELLRVLVFADREKVESGLSSIGALDIRDLPF